MVTPSAEAIAVPAAGEARPVRYGELLRFYFPLAIQAASQSLTYPLVASIASHGPGGPLNLAGMAQANGIVFMLATIGAGLLTTGLVYAKTREGYARFAQVNLIITAIAFVLQAILCLPAVAHFWYARIMGLPPSIEAPATQALIALLFLQLLFFFRNPYQVCLLVHGKTNLASAATILRIIGTVALIPFFLNFGLVGPVWAVVAQAIAVAAELLLSWYFARPLLKLLPKAKTPPPSLRALFGFTMPLSVGALFLSISGIVIAAIMAKAPDPERMLQAFYLAAGLSNPAAFAASRIQPVAITFLAKRMNMRRVFSFSLLMGALLGGIPLLFVLPWLDQVYYMGVQNCPPDILPLVRISAIGLLLHPLTMAFRAYFEGKAALLKKPVAILTGQVVYFGVLCGAAFASVRLAVPGNLLAPVAFFCANIIAGLMVHFTITWGERAGEIATGVEG